MYIALIKLHKQYVKNAKSIGMVGNCNAVQKIFAPLSLYYSAPTYPYYLPLQGLFT